MGKRRAERRAVERWLAQWGIHNDADIAGLLDALETPTLALADVRAALLVLPPPGNFDEYAKVVHQRLTGSPHEH